MHQAVRKLSAHELPEAETREVCVTGSQAVETVSDSATTVGQKRSARSLYLPAGYSGERSACSWLIMVPFT